MSNKYEDLQKFWNNKKIFLTGHTGFKGCWFSLMLKLLGAKVYGYSLKPKNKNNLFKLLKLEKKIQQSTIGDIRDYDHLKKSILKSSPDFVVHMAAQPLVLESYINPKYTYDVNATGTINLLNIINETHISKYNLIITTDKVYENYNRGKSFKESDRLGGIDPYSNSKACAEFAVKSYNESFFRKKNIFTITARAGNIVGGGDFSDNRLLPDYFRSLDSDKKLFLRNPKSVRPWQYVLEPLYGYLLILMKIYNENKFFDEPNFNFGPKSINRVKVDKVIKLVNEQFENSVEVFTENKINQNYESKILMLDSSKSKKILNWESKINIKETLKCVTSWHRELLEGNDIINYSNKQIITYLNNL